MLASTRTLLASTRTLLAYIRTALAFAGLGFAVREVEPAFREPARARALHIAAAVGCVLVCALLAVYLAATAI